MPTITDLKGYTVTVPSGWSATAGYGIFDVGVIVNKSDFSDLSDRCLCIGYRFNGEIGYGISEQAHCITFGDYAFYEYRSSTALEIEIVDGSDTNNTSLIQWFYDNNATFEKTKMGLSEKTLQLKQDFDEVYAAGYEKGKADVTEEVDTAIDSIIAIQNSLIGGDV